jgi:hypothetical protein
LANTVTSQWISPSQTYAGAGEMVGAYTYRVAFDLTGFVPGTAELDFRVASDNDITAIALNDGATGIDPASSFDFWTDVPSITSGFQAGLNWLDITVLETGTGNNTPSGLRVEFLTSEADVQPEVPEPATMGLMGLGLVGLGVLRYRRKKA